MPKKETFTSRFEEKRAGRVPRKSKIWGDIFYGWSLTSGIKYWEGIRYGKRYDINYQTI